MTVVLGDTFEGECQFDRHPEARALSLMYDQLNLSCHSESQLRSVKLEANTACAVVKDWFGLLREKNWLQHVHKIAFF